MTNQILTSTLPTFASSAAASEISTTVALIGHLFLVVALILYNLAAGLLFARRIHQAYVGADDGVIRAHVLVNVVHE